MKRIVVLGGSGFLGKHVMHLLRERGYSAVSLSRRDGCDLMDLHGLTDRLGKARPAAIINCAAHVGSVHYVIKHPAQLIHDNTQLILNIYAAALEACPQTKIINPISNCSYPGHADRYCEPEWQNGPIHDSVLPYGMTRRMIYALGECYRKQYGSQSVNWIIPNAYGPGDSTDPNKVHALNGIIIRLIQAQLLGNRKFEIWGTGKPVREWVYIADVARILVDSIAMEEQVYPLNLAQNKAYSIAEIAEIAARALDYEVEFVFNTNYADGAPIKIMDDRRFRERHPSFRFTPLEEGVRNTLDYYRSVLPAGSLLEKVAS